MGLRTRCPYTSWNASRRMKAQQGGTLNTRASFGKFCTHLLRLLHWQVGCSPLVPPQRRAETGLRSGEKRRQPAQGSCVISSRLFSPHQRIALLVGKRGIQPLEPPRLAHDSLQADAKWSLRRDSSACGRRPSNSGIQILKLPL